MWYGEECWTSCALERRCQIAKGFPPEVVWWGQSPRDEGQESCGVLVMQQLSLVGIRRTGIIENIVW